MDLGAVRSHLCSPPSVPNTLWSMSTAARYPRPGTGDDQAQEVRSEERWGRPARAEGAPTRTREIIGQKGGGDHTEERQEEGGDDGDRPHPPIDAVRHGGAIGSTLPCKTTGGIERSRVAGLRRRVYTNHAAVVPAGRWCLSSPPAAPGWASAILSRIQSGIWSWRGGSHAG